MTIISRLTTSATTRAMGVALFLSTALACGSDPEPSAPGGSSGSTAGGTGGSAGTTSGGSGGGGGSAGTATAGSAGTATAGTGGSGGSDGGTGGSGGSDGGTGGGGTAGTGGAADPTAVAVIAGVAGNEVTGTATFTQSGGMVTLELVLTACPDGEHASHLHQVKDCGNNGDAAGGHWVPNGEMLGNYTCTGGVATHSVSKPADTWTVGDAGANDVTQFSFMVHEAGDPSPGGRIGCGVIDLQ